MPTVSNPRRPRPTTTIDPQLKRLGDEIVATFRAAAVKAIASQAAPGRAALTDDPASVEHTMVALHRAARPDQQTQSTQRILAMLDGSDRPSINLTSARSAESQAVLKIDPVKLGRALKLTPAPQSAPKGTPRNDDAAAKAIDAKRAAAAFLGKPTTAITTTPDGSGRFRHYEHGSIYWTAQTGAHEVHGAIRDKWQSLGWERSFLGYPTTDETVAPDGTGRFNHFQGGSIYWSPKTGAHEVHGSIRGKWGELGFEKGYLGYPVTDETVPPDTIGRFSHFQGGSIYWLPARGAFALHKDIMEVWGKQGFELGDLGYPVEDTQLLKPKRQRFEGGLIEGTTVKKPKTRVELRLHAVGLVDESDGNNPFDAEGGSDEIEMGGAVVDPAGKVSSVGRFFVGDFNESDSNAIHKAYKPPKVLHTFEVFGAPGWPKTYVSTLMLAEVDSGGFASELKELVRKVREYALEQVKKAFKEIGIALEDAIGALGGIIGAALGALVGYALGALFDWLETLWNDIALSPVVFNTTIADVWSFTDGKDDTDRASGGGGAYNVRADYALR